MNTKCVVSASVAGISGAIFSLGPSIGYKSPAGTGLFYCLPGREATPDSIGPGRLSPATGTQ